MNSALEVCCRTLSDVKITKWLKSKEHQKLFERWWIALTIGWELIRTFAVNRTFAKYGVNTWIYFAIVITIALPYAHSTAKLLFAIVERHWRKSIIYGVIALILHFAPDVYILANAKEVPKTIFDSFIFIVVVFTLVGIRSLVVSIKTHRRHKEESS